MGANWVRCSKGWIETRTDFWTSLMSFFFLSLSHPKPAPCADYLQVVAAQLQFLWSRRSAQSWMEEKEQFHTSESRIKQHNLPVYRVNDGQELLNSSAQTEDGFCFVRWMRHEEPPDEGPGPGLEGNVLLPGVDLQGFNSLNGVSCCSEHCVTPQYVECSPLSICCILEGDWIGPAISAFFAKWTWGGFFLARTGWVLEAGEGAGIHRVQPQQGGTGERHKDPPETTWDGKRQVEPEQVHVQKCTNEWCEVDVAGMKKSSSTNEESSSTQVSVRDVAGNVVNVGK
ncbi:uncharacterized protein LOC144007434 isoform X2 [Festucalex cinctus]